MKIAVYTIALNEEQFVERWARSAEDADVRLVADTGSTDQTRAKLDLLGVNTRQVSIKPFRFDDARNAALSLLPGDIDVAIALDMDEVLVPGWRTLIEQAWVDGTTRLRYKYVWSWAANGQPDLTFQADKIAGRHTHRWKHPVHEVLSPKIPEVHAECSDVLIEHHPDHKKSRGQYLDLLMLAVREDPEDDRNAHYLGREFFFHRRFQEAITEFERHLKLVRAVWHPERAGSMRYIGKCYHALGDLTNAYKWFIRATLEDSTTREPLIDAAVFLLSQKQYHGVIHFCQKALDTECTGSYMAERYANNEAPYDLAAVAHFHLGQRAMAIALANKAVEINPHDERLQANLRMMTE